jgi:hypothetical protein
MSRKLGTDRKLCNYEDFTIFESDFRSICSSWLTDTAVNFAATSVKNDLFGKSDEKVRIFGVVTEFLMVRGI